MTPKVSIIIPAYNVEKYIAECLRSVLAQTFSAWEALVIDDGSSDDTLEVIRTFNDIRIKSFTQENIGLSATRNQGVKMAEGKYVLFLDSDDRLQKETIEKCYSLIEKYNLDAVTFDGYDFIEKNGTEEILEGGYFDRSKKLEEKIYSGQEFLKREVFQKSVVVSAPFYFVKKEKLVEVLFVKGLLHEDVLFHYQLMPLLDNIYYLPKKFYQRRLRENSIVHTTASLKSIESYQKIISYLQKRYFHVESNQKKLYRKIIEKNMLQVGKLGKRFFFSKNANKKQGFRILKDILNQGSFKIIFLKYIYFLMGAIYYVFADIKSFVK
ncbi:glycosyltransferase involved in cell wall biosynthesis [Balneicella halophila]|uniref:Glycosyltransferase involved in cell wall biosynthesis n=1 Tax=Balneicella halophila TaxID=1537566 RepID=A0A7L4UPZ7_BALHA|nr:glycosyltransferase family A protein [Balneicella halophila]PVX51836.1 glycosyltransferase involved in cell wall biosynthesis [Balneicella halophila]